MAFLKGYLDNLNQPYPVAEIVADLQKLSKPMRDALAGRIVDPWCVVHMGVARALCNRGLFRTPTGGLTEEGFSLAHVEHELRKQSERAQS